MPVRVYFPAGGRSLLPEAGGAADVSALAGPSIEVQWGTSLFSAARRLGLPVGHACAAEGLCGQCGLRVLAGRGLLSEESDAEADLKSRNRVDSRMRLSCMSRVVGLEGSVFCTADYW